MKDATKKKILIGMDGSDRAFETVKYVSKIPSYQKYHVVLYNVFSKIPEAYWDLEKQPQLKRKVTHVRAWEVQRKKEIKDYMDKARQLLVEAGFPLNSINVKIEEKEEGIARYMISEANRGYRAVLVGRRGISRLKNLILGSVTTKLFERVTFAPLLLIGKNSSPDKVLVALDGSENSMRGVDYVGTTLKDSGFKIRLIHVIRGEDKDYIKNAGKVINEFFDEAKERLEKSGFKPRQISTKIITGKESRAGAIVEIARKEGYGTIVMGRRGHSERKEFSMGRVTNKVVYMAKGLAVWVVN